MSSETTIGILLDESTCYAAIGGPDRRFRAVERPDLMPHDWPVDVELQADSVFPVRFHSRFSPTAASQQWFRDWLETVANDRELSGRSRRLGLTFIEPFDAEGLNRVRRAVRASNCPQAMLVDGAIATAVAYAGLPEARALLIVRVGLQSTELSLVSVCDGVLSVRDRWHVPLLCRRWFDGLMAAALSTAINVSANQPADWRRRWLDVCRVRLELDQAQSAALPLSAAWRDKALAVVIRDTVWPAIEPSLAALCQIASALLRANGQSEEELSATLLAGSSPVSWRQSVELVQSRFPNVSIGGPDACALGAALLADRYAVGKMGIPLPRSMPAGMPLTAEEQYTALASIFEVSPLESALTADEEPSQQWNPADVSAVWSTFRQQVRNFANVPNADVTILLKQLEHGYLELVAELHGLSQRKTRQSVTPRLAAAYTALAADEPEEAIRIAHDAHARSTDEPDLFREMIDIHVRAAAQTANPEEAIAWLECALVHDQLQMPARVALADRCAELANIRLDRGQLAEAQRLIARCLSIVPEHATGRALQSRIGEVPRTKLLSE